METRQSRRQTTKVSHSRWLAYATAGAATALAGSHCLEAAIHYSGRLEERFPQGSNKREQFRLDQPGDHFSLIHLWNGSLTNGLAAFNIIGFSRGFRGLLMSTSVVYSVSKLGFGQNISSGNFVQGRRRGSYNLLAGGYVGQWQFPGVGFIGFKFNGGAGIQYGWARVRMYGHRNAFKLVDYAYADPGEPITAGETGQSRSDEQGPDEGSLGGLALGAVGLLAWRRSRSQAAR